MLERAQSFSETASISFHYLRTDEQARLLETMLWLEKTHSQNTLKESLNGQAHWLGENRFYYKWESYYLVIEIKESGLQLTNLYHTDTLEHFRDQLGRQAS